MKLYEIYKARKIDRKPLFTNHSVAEENPEWLELYLSKYAFIDSMFVAKYGERDFYGGFLDGDSEVVRYNSLLNGYMLDMEHNIERIWDALTKEYEILDNYDRQEVHTTTNTGDTLIKSGSFTEDNARTGFITNAKSGSETNTENVGSVTTTTTDSKAPIDSSTYLDNNKTVTNNGEGQQNTNTLSFTDRMDTQTFNNYHDKVEHTFDDYKEGINTTTTETIRAHGNIGTTRNGEMIDDELRIRQNSFFDLIFKPFVFEYFY